jgi:hypothetical protein
VAPPGNSTTTATLPPRPQSRKASTAKPDSGRDHNGASGGEKQTAMDGDGGGGGSNAGAAAATQHSH